MSQQNDHENPPRRTGSLKRSTRVQLAAMGVAAGAASLTGCGNSPSPPQAPVFTSVEQCMQSGTYTQQECETGLQFALSQQYQSGAKQFSNEQKCEATFGPGECHRYKGPSGDIWMGLLGGYLIGELLNNNRRDYYAYNYGGSWYHYDAYDRHTRRSTRPPADLPKPANATIPKPTKAHTAAITRGGFGSSARSGRSYGG